MHCFRYEELSVPLEELLACCTYACSEHQVLCVLAEILRHIFGQHSYSSSFLFAFLIQIIFGRLEKYNFQNIHGYLLFIKINQRMSVLN